LNGVVLGVAVTVGVGVGLALGVGVGVDEIGGTERFFGELPKRTG